MKQKIFLSFSFLLVSMLSLTAQSKLKVSATLYNPSHEINNGEISISVVGGEAPYTYHWDIASVALTQGAASGITEGAEFTVTVKDANGLEGTLSQLFPATSIEETLNSKFIPVVNGFAAFFFWDPLEFLGLRDPKIYAEQASVIANQDLIANTDKAVLEQWFITKGTKVQVGDMLGVVSFSGGVLDTLYAKEVGTFIPQYVEDEVLVSKSTTDVQVGPRDLAFIKFAQPQVVLNPNGTPQTQGVPIIVLWLVLGALFFTIRMGFINFRGVRHALELVAGKFDNPDDKGEVSHFQALTTALSATVGLGNIAGVAVAITLGGPGATFWMVIAGLIGMASKFVECTLGVKYRKINENGEVSGGPMYYLSAALEKQNKKVLGKVLAFIFTILCIGASFGGGNMFQANQAFAQLSNKMPALQGNGVWFGIVLAILVGIVIIGGIKSIAKVTDKIVPFMCGIYVLFALIIIGMNFTLIDDVFMEIINGAFSPSALKGGVVGVLIVGFQRAAFSNEAGVGSASIAHSASKTDEPVSEGIVSLLEPFVDTVLVCTMTALVLVFTGFADGASGLTGSELTSEAFSSVFPWFSWVLVVAIFLFAFSTMISWSYYGLKAWGYLFGDSKLASSIYKIIFLFFIVVGSSVGLGAVLDFSDLMILGMAFPNILGLLLLSNEVRSDLKIYLHKIKTGVIKRYK